MGLRVVYANQPFPDSWTSLIFLLGPTPRRNPVSNEETAESWRPEAIKYLEELGYDGVVAVPEDEDGTWKHNYDDQIEWEELGLNYADVIIAHMDRDLTLLDVTGDKKAILKMPAFTSNDEWGVWKTLDPSRLILCTPPGADKVRYQQYYADKRHITTCDNLEDACAAAYTTCKLGEWKSPTGKRERSGGERCVPLHIWRTDSFQHWYENLRAAGNRLESARVEWVFRVGPELQHVFFWILHVAVYITAEDRHKTNEVVIGRPDISTVLLYERAKNILDSRIILIKEFRSPASNRSGYVWELAGGSSWKANQNSATIARDECEEEAGISIPHERFRVHQVRQLCATTLSHRAHLFSAKLDKLEMDEVVRNQDVIRGVEADTERTWAKVHTYGEILASENTDWSMLGMIASVLH